MSWNKIIECVPNFSEGRDLEKIDQIVAPFRIKAGVKLLDYSNDEDHNRLVVTLVGEPEALYEAIVEAVGAGCPFDRPESAYRATSPYGSGRCHPFHPD